jgi:hypothetical protein
MADVGDRCGIGGGEYAGSTPAMSATIRVV